MELKIIKKMLFILNKKVEGKKVICVKKKK